jgi:hypothetical protein
MVLFWHLILFYALVIFLFRFAYGYLKLKLNQKRLYREVFMIIWINVNILTVFIIKATYLNCF